MNSSVHLVLGGTSGLGREIGRRLRQDEDEVWVLGSSYSDADGQGMRVEKVYSERGEAQTFWSDFLSIFGIDRRRHGAFFEYAIKKGSGSQGYVDMFWPGKLLADLYDPLTLPQSLARAHKALDRAVDRLYRREPFATDADRVAMLFERYQKATQKNELNEE